MKYIYKSIILIIILVIASIYLAYTVFPQGNIAILRTSGGLGNQIFQYAGAYSFAKKNNLDLYVLKGNNHKSKNRPFVLDKLFDMKDKIITYPFIKQYALSVLNIFSLRSFTIIDMNNINDEFNITKQSNRIFFIKSWFEAIGFFKDYQQEIQQQYNPHSIIYNSNLKPLIMQVSAKNNICIHLRLTDFHTNNNIIKFEYYNKALSLLTKKFEPSKIFLFSDNISEASSILTKYSINHHTFKKYNLNSLEDFILLSHCANNIIANSTFSWWAAFLNKNSQHTTSPDFLSSGKFQKTLEKFPPHWSILN